MSKRKIIIGAIILAVVVAALVGTSFVFGKKNEFTKVEITKLKRAPFTVTVSASGSVEAENSQEVHAAVTGRIAKLLVDEGSVVRAGQPVALLDDADFAATFQQAQASVAQAQADLAQLRGVTPQRSVNDNLEVKQAAAQLASAQARLAEVKKGATEAQLAQAQATLSQAEQTLADAKAERERDQRLLSAGAIPRRQLEDAVNRVHTADAACRAAQKAFDDFRTAPTREQLHIAQAAVDQARASLALARDHAATKNDSVRAAEARVRQARASQTATAAQYSDTRLVSPIDGTVITKALDSGQAVIPGALVLKVASLGKVLVKAKVEEADIDKVRVGQGAVVTADAAVGIKLRGKVTKIAPAATTDGNVMKFIVEVETENRGEVLKPGMTADVEITTYRNPEALIVPVQAVLERPAAEPSRLELSQGTVSASASGGKLLKVVYVVRQGAAHRVNVVLGPLGVTDVEVRSGLKAGDRLVTGDYKALKTLRDGDKVKPGETAAPTK